MLRFKEEVEFIDLGYDLIVSFEINV